MVKYYLFIGIVSLYAGDRSPASEHFLREFEDAALYESNSSASSDLQEIDKTIRLSSINLNYSPTIRTQFEQFSFLPRDIVCLQHAQASTNYNEDICELYDEQAKLATRINVNVFALQDSATIHVPEGDIQYSRVAFKKHAATIVGIVNVCFNESRSCHYTHVLQEVNQLLREHSCVEHWCMTGYFDTADNNVFRATYTGKASSKDIATSMQQLGFNSVLQAHQKTSIFELGEDVLLTEQENKLFIKNMRVGQATVTQCDENTNGIISVACLLGAAPAKRDPLTAAQHRVSSYSCEQ